MCIRDRVRAALNANILQFEAYLECTFQYTTVGNILQFCVHYGVTFTWLSVLKVDANPYLPSMRMQVPILISCELIISCLS